MSESETCIIDTSPNPEADSIEIEAEGVLVSAECSSNELDVARTRATDTTAGQKHFFGRLADSFTHLRNERKVKKEYKSQAKELAAEKDQLEKDEETYKDNLFILSNHDDIVIEQKTIIRTAQEKRERLQSELTLREAALATATVALQQAKSKRDKEVEPHQERYDNITEKIRAVENDIRDLESDKRNLESERYGASDAKLRSLDSRIDAKNKRIEDKEERIKDLQDRLRDIDDRIREIKNKHASGIAAATAAVTAASAAVADTAKHISDETKKIENAHARIERCDYVVSHPEETPLLKQKIEQEKVTIAEHERELAATEERLAMLGEGSKLAKRFLAICASALIVIAIAIALIVSSLPGQTTQMHHSPTASQTSAKASSSSEQSSEKTSEDDTDAEEALEAIAQKDRALIPSSHTIETRYYTVKVPDATDEWAYDYVNAYSTSSWNRKGDVGYITYVYRNDVLIFEIACFGGVATPEGDVASAFIGTLDVPGTGELSVFAVVPIDREGPNADVAASNAVDEANYYAENVNLNPDYMATAAEPESTDASSSDEYVLPASDSEYYTRDQLEGLSDWELYVARNEVFARYGRQFKNEALADYFFSQPWYNGEYPPEDFDGWFSPNEYEKANTDLILEIEHERNSPYLN